jgi:hypothetical protein
MDAAGGAVGKRVVPILAVIVAFLALRSLRRRGKRRRRSGAVAGGRDGVAESTK